MTIKHAPLLPIGSSLTNDPQTIALVHAQRDALDAAAAAIPFDIISPGRGRAGAFEIVRAYLRVIREREPGEVIVGPHGHWYAMFDRELWARPMQQIESVPVHPSINDDGWYEPEDLDHEDRGALLTHLGWEPTDDELANRHGVEGGIAYDTTDRRTEDDV